MRLYIFRHAEAWPLGTQGITAEAERFLTPKGQRQARATGQAMAMLEAYPDAVWCSPWLRARQSAELAMKEWPDPAPLHLVPALMPPGDPVDLLAQLRATAARSVLLVGHETFLGDLLGHLLHGPGDHPIPLAKASLAALSWAPATAAPGELQWLLSRKIIKSLARRR